MALSLTLPSSNLKLPIDRTSHGCEMAKMKNARAKRANSFSLVIVQISDVFVPPVIVMVAFSVASKGRKM